MFESKNIVSSRSPTWISLGESSQLKAFFFLEFVFNVEEEVPHLKNHLSFYELIDRFISPFLSPPTPFILSIFSLFHRDMS